MELRHHQMIKTLCAGLIGLWTHYLIADAGYVNSPPVYFHPGPGGPVTSVVPPYIHGYAVPVYAGKIGSYLASAPEPPPPPPPQKYGPTAADFARFFYSQPSFIPFPSLYTIPEQQKSPPFFSSSSSDSEYVPPSSGEYKTFSSPPSEYGSPSSEYGPPPNDEYDGPPPSNVDVSSSSASSSAGGFGDFDSYSSSYNSYADSNSNSDSSSSGPSGPSGPASSNVQENIETRESGYEAGQQSSQSGPTKESSLEDEDTINVRTGTGAEVKSKSSKKSKSNKSKSSNKSNKSSELGFRSSAESTKEVSSTETSSELSAEIAEPNLTDQDDFQELGQSDDEEPQHQQQSARDDSEEDIESTGFVVNKDGTSVQVDLSHDELPLQDQVLYENETDSRENVGEQGQFESKKVDPNSSSGAAKGGRQSSLNSGTSSSSISGSNVANGGYADNSDNSSGINAENSSSSQLGSDQTQPSAPSGGYQASNSTGPDPRKSSKANERSSPAATTKSGGYASPSSSSGSSSGGYEDSAPVPTAQSGGFGMKESAVPSQSLKSPSRFSNAKGSDNDNYQPQSTASVVGDATGAAEAQDENSSSEGSDDDDSSDSYSARSSFQGKGKNGGNGTGRIRFKKETNRRSESKRKILRQILELIEELE